MRKTRSLEKPIENMILNWLSARGVFVFKVQKVGIFDPRKKIFRKSFNPHHINGVSDILGIYQGRFLAIEVKSETGRATPEQKAFIERVNASGGIAFIARSIEDVEEKLRGQ